MALTPEEWTQVRGWFDRLVDQPATARAALLQQADLAPALQAELRSLLEHADAVQTAGGEAFLAEPAALTSAAGPAADGPPVQPGDRLGNWSVVRLLGEGGMGQVFEVRRADGQYEGRAAAKLLKRGMDSQAVLARFAQERQALARLQHPHIATLLDAGATAHGLPFFVMAHVEGQPIDLAVRGLAPAARLGLFLQLADAVAYAHRQLLVHRDLKPSNVLVTPEGQVKLLDFGIAKALESTDDDAHTTLGTGRAFTPYYASPEQVRGERVGTGTDIYSLGVLLYQLLTGTRPTGRRATTPAEAARSVLEEEPTRPSRLSASDGVDPWWLQHRQRLAGDLDNILLKALAKAPEARYATVDALAADLQAFLDGRPVSARAASPGYVLGKFLRRHRWVVLAGSLGGLGLATGLAAALLQGRAALAIGVLASSAGLGLALLQRQKAVQARALAESYLAETRTLVQDVMAHHVDAVHVLPGGAALKQQVLQNLTGHLTRLARQAQHDDPFAGVVAMAWARLAHVAGDMHVLGTVAHGEAVQHARQALPLFARAEAAHRGDPWFWIWWQRAYRALAFEARQRQELAAAVGFAQQGLDLMARATPHHHQPRLLAEWGSAAFVMGQLHFALGVPSLGQPEQALPHFAQAEAIYQGLVDRGEAVPEDLHQLGTVAGARAMLHFSAQQLPEALACARLAVAMRERVLGGEPDNVAFRYGTATECNNLAAIALELDEGPLALAHARRARALMDDLVQAEPSNRQRLRSRSQQGLHLARALWATGDWAGARAELQRLTDPQVPEDLRCDALRLAWAQATLAQVLLALGEPVSAREAAQAAAPLLQQAAARLEAWRDQRQWAHCQAVLAATTTA